MIPDETNKESTTCTLSQVSAYIISSTIATAMGVIAGHPLDTVIVSNVSLLY